MGGGGKNDKYQFTGAAANSTNCSLPYPFWWVQVTTEKNWTCASSLREEVGQPSSPARSAHPKRVQVTRAAQGEDRAEQNWCAFQAFWVPPAPSQHWLCLSLEQPWDISCLRGGTLPMPLPHLYPFCLSCLLWDAGLPVPRTETGVGSSGTDTQPERMWFPGSSEGQEGTTQRRAGENPLGGADLA